MSAHTKAAVSGQHEAIVAGPRAVGTVQVISIPTTITPTTSYDTGGSAVTLPDGASALTLKAIAITNWVIGSHMYVWNGSTSTPKLKCLTALPSTEVASTTDLSADAPLTVIFYYVR